MVSKTEIEERRARWVEALRSGEYEQGFGRLRQSDVYCCLGVACDVYKRLTGQGKWIEHAVVTLNGEKLTVYEFLSGGVDPESVDIEEKHKYLSSACLPEEVAKFFDVEPGGSLKEGVSGEGTYLFTLNDRAKMSLREIADFIEEKSDDLIPFEGIGRPQHAVEQ